MKNTLKNEQLLPYSVDNFYLCIGRFVCTHNTLDAVLTSIIQSYIVKLDRKQNPIAYGIASSLNFNEKVNIIKHREKLLNPSIDKTMLGKICDKSEKSNSFRNKISHNPVYFNDINGELEIRLENLSTVLGHLKIVDKKITVESAPVISFNKLKEEIHKLEDAFALATKYLHAVSVDPIETVES